jgi:gliding motility-associated-like protein
LDLGPDQTLCQNSFASALNAQNPGATFAWTVDGAALTTAQSRAVDTTIPRANPFIYQVIVTDPITTCTLTEVVEFTIIASPSFTLSGTDPTVCLGTDGTLAVNMLLTAPPTGPYSYFITGPGGFNQQAIDQAAPQVVNIIGLAAGTYSGIISDQISGCTISQSFGLTDAPFTATALGLAPNCDPVTIEVTTNAVAFPLQYRLTENISGSITGPTGGIPTAIFNTTPVGQGTYTVEITDNAGCIFNINNFAVNPAAPLALTFDNTGICATPPIITAVSPATAYAWSGPGIVGPTNGPSIQVSGLGTFTYTLTASGGPGTCPNTQNDIVVVDNPAADFTQSDPCQNTVNLTASPSGTYTYHWYRNASAVIAALGQFISLGLPDNGDSYEVELQNNLNGCTYPKSAPKIVQVTGVVDAAVTATPACEDGKPFTLTATTTAASVTYAWLRDNAPLSGETASTTSQIVTGTYKVQVSKATCQAEASLTITRAPIPIGLLPNSTLICNDDENTDPSTSQVELNPGTFIQYDWFKNNLSLNYTLPTLTADSEGHYRVDLTNSFQCVASDEVEVLNDCQPKIDAPNAFRPASSIDLNKNFFAITKFITDGDFQIFIFNRWGEMVYQSNDRDFKWNGGMNNSQGQPLPGGSYSYVIKYIFPSRARRSGKARRRCPA